MKFCKLFGLPTQLIVLSVAGHCFAGPAAAPAPVPATKTTPTVAGKVEADAKGKPKVKPKTEEPAKQNPPPAVGPGAAAPAPAVAREVTVSIPNLVDHKVVISSNQLRADVAPANACVLNSAEDKEKNTLTVALKDLNNATCVGLLGMNQRKTPVATLLGDGKYAIFSLVTAATQEGAADANSKVQLSTNGTVITSKLPAGRGGATATLYWSNGVDWTSASQQGTERLVLPKDLATALSKKGSHATVYVNFSGDSLLAGGDVVVATISNKAAPRKPTPDPHWCSPAPDVVTVCLDFYADLLATGKHRVSVYPRDTNHVLQPNQSVRVIVLRPITSGVVMELGGTEGVYAPADRDLTGSGHELQADMGAGEDQAPGPDFDINDQEFAPRLPGQANLTVTLTGPDGKPDVQTVEFIVEPTYVGAVRIGVAALFAGATDRAYGTRSVAGSKQTEIVATTKQKSDIELVLGYSAYLSPRGYANADWLRFEPYVGIGVLNDSPTGLQTLKSLHAGIEWEPSANFGIAVTGVLRRVTRLADGLRVGSPVTGDVPTVQKVDGGVGIVFNLSPDFFRVAKSSGSSFFK